MKNRKIKKFLMLGTFILIGIGLFYEMFNIYGKYYASRNNKGIAIASNLYFNSDKLTKIDRIIDVSAEDWKTDINWVKDNLAGRIMVYTNNERWSNGYYDFDVFIQNYDSNILYNEAGMDVGYKIEFLLLDEPVGATYSIVDDGQDYPLAYGKVVTLEGSLSGGTLNTHNYKIRMNLTDTIDNYEKARVLAIAYPNSPDYLEKSENQPFLMTGVFAGTASNMELTIASQNFQVVEDNYDFDTNHVNYINDLAGFIYNIKTEGDVIKNADTAIKQQMIVKWKSDYLNISRYDEYYDESRITTGVEDGIHYSYMTIDVLPYTSIYITFYKTDKFIEEMKPNGELYNSCESFKNLVYAYKEDTD